MVLSYADVFSFPKDNTKINVYIILPIYLILGRTKTYTIISECMNCLNKYLIREINIVLVMKNVK